MADLTQTSADVQFKGDASVVTFVYVQAAEALVPGNWVYKNTSSKYAKAQASAAAETADALAATVAGMVMTPAAAANDYFILATNGPVDPGGTMTIADEYYLSAATAGGMMDTLASTNWNTRLGAATAADTFDINIDVTGAQVP